MKHFCLAFLLLAAVPAGAASPSFSSDDAMKDIFQFHKGIVQELAKDYVEGQAQGEALLPNQKNTLLKIHYLAKKTNEQPVQAPTPVEHTYSTRTVWANLTVHVTDFHGHFKVAVESDTPIDGWIIKRISSKAVVTKGGENTAYNFVFDVYETFNDDYSLTVMVNKDGMTNPALVPLRNQRIP